MSKSEFVDDTGSTRLSEVDIDACSASLDESFVDPDKVSIAVPVDSKFVFISEFADDINDPSAFEPDADSSAPSLT